MPLTLRIISQACYTFYVTAAILFKSILHNIGVLFVGLIFALIGVGADLVFKLNRFSSPLFMLIGIVLMIIGFLIRVWATYYFYRFHMGVIVLHPQKKLITSGPFHFSRNPLYLGGNVFIFLGAVLLLGTPSGVVLTLLQLPLTDFMIRREEKQLEQTFGKEWLSYKEHVRRWL